MIILCHKGDNKICQQSNAPQTMDLAAQYIDFKDNINNMWKMFSHIPEDAAVEDDSSEEESGEGDLRSADDSDPRGSRGS